MKISTILKEFRHSLPVQHSLENTIDRGKERNRRAALTGAASTIARAVQAGTSLITVPLTIHYLGTERFGLWMTISSVLAMAAFADFGLGNGVLNTVATAYGKDNIQGIRSAISSGVAVLAAIATGVLVLYFFVYHFVSWGDFFRVVSPQARLEAGPALTVFVVCFALNIPLDVVQRVQLGMQRGYRNGLWQMSGSVFGLAGVLVGIWLQVSLPVLVMAIAGGPLFATLLNAIHFFGAIRKDLRPSLSLISRDVIFEIARIGGLFFVLQLCVSVAFSADNFIIARTLGAIQVPDYSIPQRLFGLISMVVAMLVSPLWPAYGEAISRGDMKWVRKTLKGSLLMVFVLALAASGLLLMLAPWIIRLWVGTRIHTSFALLLGLAIWTVMDCCGNTLAMFMNGASIIRFQVIVASLFAVTCITTKLFLTRHYGSVGVPWATIITYGLVSAVPCAFYVPRALARLHVTRQTISVAPSAHDIIEI
ncbi:MAG: oligosaccharide flippase family protein [Chthonomonadales bacterium]